MVIDLYQQLKKLQAEINQFIQKLTDLINNSIFEDMQNMIIILENFFIIIEEFNTLGFFDNVQNFNDFIISIIENAEEILILYPNFNDYKEEFYNIGE